VLFGSAPTNRLLAAGLMLSFLAFIVANMAPLMFAALVVVLLMGYPVAFSLGAIGMGMPSARTIPGPAPGGRDRSVAASPSVFPGSCRSGSSAS
jgi:hypothetical protein